MVSVCVFIVGVISNQNEPTSKENEGPKCDNAIPYSPLQHTLARMDHIQVKEDSHLPIAIIMLGNAWAGPMH